MCLVGCVAVRNRSKGGSESNICDQELINRPISVYRLGEMPIQSCGQSVSAPRGKASVRLNAHTELRAKRQRSAREAIYRNRPIQLLFACITSFVTCTSSTTWCTSTEARHVIGLQDVVRTCTGALWANNRGENVYRCTMGKQSYTIPCLHDALREVCSHLVSQHPVARGLHSSTFQLNLSRV